MTKEGLSIELPQELPSPFEDIVVNMVPGAQSLGTYALGKSVDGKKRLLIDGELPAEGDRWTTDTIVSDYKNICQIRMICLTQIKEVGLRSKMLRIER